MTEQDMKKALGFTYQNVRTLAPEEYPVFKAAGIGAGLIGEKFTATARPGGGV